MRVYTAEHREFTLEDVNFVQAMGCITGMALYMARHYKGMKQSIDLPRIMRASGTKSSGSQSAQDRP